MAWFSKPKASPVSAPIRDALFAHLSKQASPAGNDADVLAVTLEYMIDGGMDLIAAFPGDDGARYYNHSGRAVVWNLRGDLAPQIDALLTAGRRMASQVGLYAGEPVPNFQAGDIRISVFTKRGRHFGQGPMEEIAGDAVGKPVINAGITLMQALMAKAP
ncbi:MAG: hypothetical protein V4510_00995 [bacterium]